MNTHLIIKLGAYDWLDTLNKNRNQIKFKKKPTRRMKTLIAKRIEVGACTFVALQCMLFMAV